jgi:hypothetical protein
MHIVRLGQFGDARSSSEVTGVGPFEDGLISFNLESL